MEGYDPTLPKAVRGRGSLSNPNGRFEKTSRETGDYSQLAGAPAGGVDARSIEIEEMVQEARPTTEVLDDHSASVLTTNDSPDVGFDSSVNPYRGCEHGCIYCYARPTHEYLGHSAGIDFETKIYAKREASALLRKALLSRSYRPKVVNLSGVTDCYQPLERKLRLTRGCIEVLSEFRNPFTIITKNALVTRDIDLIAPMAERNATMVLVSITTLDASLVEKMEPRTSRPEARLRAIEALSKAGIPAGVMVAPVVPGLTDSEMPAILKAASEAGARVAGYVPLRLPYGLGTLFEEWLTSHFPERKDKILNRVRAIRGGKTNDPNFGSRMRGEGVFAEQIRSIFELYTRKYGINVDDVELTTEHFRRVENPGQLDLFG
jgi:DNA repair photolyase